MTGTDGDGWRAQSLPYDHANCPDPAGAEQPAAFFKNPVVPAVQAAALRERYRRCHNIRSMRPEQVKLAAGWLIEQAGWKEAPGITTDSPAAVSERHALVLINRGGAAGAQLWGWRKTIQFDVADKFGVLLQPEPASFDLAMQRRGDLVRRRSEAVAFHRIPLAALPPALNN